ncbi:MAG: hypothetical protein O2854_09935 [Chloroflexi bacterium]|nr:hypothetical protein [Chloroflexota bacterium]
MTTRQWNPIALTPMHSRQLALGASMTIRNGWMRVSRYTTGVDEETDVIQRAAGIADVSHRGKLRLQGTSIPERLKEMGITVPEIGHAIRLPLKIGDASMVVSIARLSEEEAAITTGAFQASQVIDAIGETDDSCLHAIDVSSALACIRVIGPSAHKVLTSITEVDLDPVVFPNMHCLQGMFAGIQGMLIRVDSGSIPSYGLYYGREFGEHVWDTLLLEAAWLGARPVGFESLLKIGSGTN